MRDIIDTDRELIRLLLEDARRPYSELAEAVGLSPPAVSDRVDRLRDPGVVERFSLDLDRSRLREGVRLAVTVSVAPGETATVGTAGVEHVFAPADARLIVVARVPDAEVDRHMATASRPGRSSPSTCRR
jgi:DNA-binding Lrp family transcriptional regulator